jgi:hypothetical protein
MLIRFILMNILVIFILSIISYKVYERTSKEKKTYKEFIVGKKMSYKGIMVGLSFGIVFGFLDNMGLMIGIDALTKNFNMSNMEKSAFGNTYSDFIGATVGTFISIILKQILDYDDDGEPIWLNSLGIVIGCLLGYYVPVYVRRLM